MCAFLDISGLTEFWTVVTCVLLLPCGSMSAPTGKPIWVDPCGGVTVHETQGEGCRTSDRDLLSSIKLSAQNALETARQFSHDYVRKTFDQKFESHDETWRANGYPWLPSKEDVPKHLGEKTSVEHLNNLAQKELNANLLDSYRYLQIIAVGLEQVHLDKKQNKDEFTEEFETIQYKLRQVLCEVQSALVEREPGVSIVDVTRDVMHPNIRQAKDESFRHIRDWFIFRDFMNCLEYLIDVCEFFGAK